MPSVIDAPVQSDHDAHNLQDEQSQVRVARVGCCIPWCSMCEDTVPLRHLGRGPPLAVSGTRGRRRWRARRQSLGPSCCWDSGASTMANTRAAR